MKKCVILEMTKVILSNLFKIILVILMVLGLTSAIVGVLYGTGFIVTNIFGDWLSVEGTSSFYNYVNYGIESWTLLLFGFGIIVITKNTIKWTKNKFIEVKFKCL